LLKIAEIEKQDQNLPLMNTDDTDREKPKALKRGGTEEAEEMFLPQICADER